MKSTGCLSGLVGLVACVLPLLPGCSLIYSADEFDVPDAGIPADAYQDPCVDVDARAGFTLESVTPSRVEEGQGCLMDGEVCGPASRGVPVVVTGCHIPADATLELSGGLEGTPADAVISADGRMAAFTVRVPVDETRGKDASDEVVVTVSQGEVSQSVSFTVQWLDELVVSDLGESINADDLDPRYSRIAFDQPVALTGTRAARFVATSEIVLGADIDAGGQDGDDSQGGAGGPGGCDGGDRVGMGGCNPGGGGPGGSVSLGKGGGGGGGGHAGQGDNGDGDNQGQGGPETGDPTLVPLLGDRGHGGGGGGNGGLGNGGGGGGGGGVVELTCGGQIRVTAPAAVTARGGSGGSNQCATLNGGGGGGGSGGAVLLRAASLFLDQGVDTENLSVDVSGGAGAGTNNCHKGGDGADGRVRVDLPSGASLPSALVDQPHTYRGPVIASGLTPISRESRVSVTVYGGLGKTYWLERVGQDKVSVEVVDQDSLAVTQDIDLAPGRNELCALVSEQITVADQEGRNCLTIAYIP